MLNFEEKGDLGSDGDEGREQKRCLLGKSKETEFIFKMDVYE